MKENIGSNAGASPIRSLTAEERANRVCITQVNSMGGKITWYTTHSCFHDMLETDDSFHCIAVWGEGTLVIDAAMIPEGGRLEIEAVE